MVRVGINGLGRIGRCLFRLLCALDKEQEISIVAVNGSSEIGVHTHLIKYDSVHGTFEYDVENKGDDLIEVNGRNIKYFRIKNPEEIPWDSCGVDVVFECTGKFNKKLLSTQHLGRSVKKVIVSAPVEDADIQVIYGINEGSLRSEHQIISVGSCTTNCAAHVVGIIDKEFELSGGFITTVHSYTNDQNHVDGSHKDLRRARACNLSMIPSTTGASKALSYLFPHLQGKISASAIRVPTPNVSLVDFAFTTGIKVTKEMVNCALSSAASSSNSVLLATSKPLVSVDFNHTSYSAVFDLTETHVNDSNFSRIVAWYDNEWAFSSRMIDVLKVARRFL
ncbi:MAG: type I glyceraldehyde-3-phosphate dehydrogenase [Aaplasma endosymbiont of Hyalomma asiaticum]